MHFEELETRRLKLLNISNNDCDFIYNEFSNEFINRYLFDVEPVKNKSEAQEIIDFYTVPEPRNRHRWILVLKNGNIKIGTCGFHCINYDDKTLEIGYDLLEEYNGNGYMVEALIAAIDYAIIKFDIKTMEGRVYIENENSIKLLEKLEFTNEGEVFENFMGKEYKHYIFKRRIV